TPRSPTWPRTSPRKREEAEMATATHRVVGPRRVAPANGAAGQMAASANLQYVPTEHEPVLAAELVDVLDPRPGETFVDCTFGGGGHARLIAERLGPQGELIAGDRGPGPEEPRHEISCELGRRGPFRPADLLAALRALPA